MAFVGAFIMHKVLNTIFTESTIHHDVKHIYVTCVFTKLKFTQGHLRAVVSNHKYLDWRIFA